MYNENKPLSNFDFKSIYFYCIFYKLCTTLLLNNNKKKFKFIQPEHDRMKKKKISSRKIASYYLIIDFVVSYSYFRLILC